MRFLRGATPSARVVVTGGHRLGRELPHLNATQRRFFADHARSTFSEVADYCLEAKAGALIIAGDLFDSSCPFPEDLMAVARCCKSLVDAGIKVAGLSGRTDGPTAHTVSPIRLLAALDLLAELQGVDTSARLLLEVGGLRVAVSALSSGELSPESRNPLRILDRRVDADFHFLVTSFAVESLAGESAAGPSINLDSVRALLGVNVLVAGQSPAPSHGMVGEVLVVAPRGYAVDEGEGGFISMEISQRGVEEIETVGLASIPLREIVIQGSELELDDAHARLKTRLQPELAREARTVLRLVGKVREDCLLAARLAALDRWASDQSASFEVELSNLVVVTESGQPTIGMASPVDEVRRAASVLNDGGGEGGEVASGAAELLLARMRRRFGGE